MWAGLAARNVTRARRVGSAIGEARRAGVGFVLAGLLLVGSSSAFTGILAGGTSSSLTLAPRFAAEHLQAIGAFDARPGGLGVLHLGPLAIAGVAVVLAWRDRLVLALAAGAGMLVLAWLALEYPAAPWDINRLAGHGRNLALLALVLALSARLASLPLVRWRYAVAALLVGLITWPTAVAPARSLGLAVARGVQLANAATWVHEVLIEQGVEAVTPAAIPNANHLRPNRGLHPEPHPG